jgi:triacylglycerol lipase
MTMTDDATPHPPRADRCATRYPIILVHGMGFQARIMGLIDYWGAIPRALTENGADVHISRVNAMDSHEKKAGVWREQVLGVLERTGMPKVNVIGHSDGCLYSRYAISNLGLASKVASHTSLAGPHRGSAAADIFMGSIPGPLRQVVGAKLDFASSLVMGDVNPDCLANGHELTREYMSDRFNPGAPDMPEVYYQSYGFRGTNALGAGLLTPSWMALLAREGENDGLVSVASARWGEYRGTIDGGALSAMGGINHLAIVGMHPSATPGYAPAGFFVTVAAGIKDMGF